ncbi:MAG: hypothetical protein GXP54_01940 [Deltaproteobacteria bacterium]|nr:hypothetical protein [Deltaproteobacteria bacterium]
MLAEPASSQDVVGNAEPQDLLEVYCYLACMGPESFERTKALELVTCHSGPDRAFMVGLLLDPGRRDERSHELGRLLAENLSNREDDTGNIIATLLPALLRADTMNGFSVLKGLAAAASRPLAKAFSEVLLSMAVAESASVNSDRPNFLDDGDSKEWTIRRIRYLVSVITMLNLDAASRTRLFLALSQTLEDRELVRDVVLTSLFPSDSQQGRSVFLDGNDQALQALLKGAAARPNGKSEFYSSCRSVMDLGIRKGLPALARIYRIINLPESGARALSSMVRAAVLLAFEKAAMSTKDIRSVLPEEPDLSSLDILTVVAPGIKEPQRSQVCDYLLDGSAQLLLNNGVTADDCDRFAQVVVGAAVLHADSQKAGARVRKLFLDGAGSIHAGLQSGARSRSDSESAMKEKTHPFSKIVDIVYSEFKRRESLSSCLVNVVPLISGFGRDSVPIQAGAMQLDAFAD